VDLKRHLSLIILLLLILSLPVINAAASTPAVIRAVLFYSPTCDRCHEVMEKVLPPLTEEYPNQLDIVGVDVSHPVGQQLYQQMVSEFNLPDDRLGVPTLVVGSSVLVGIFEIEDNFPSIIQTGLSAGGFEWPNIPGLEQVLAAQADPTTQTTSSIASPPADIQQGVPGFIARFNQDPLANSIAVIVLIGMIVLCLVVLTNYLRGSDQEFVRFPEWILPLLSILGLGIALYLSYIEISRSNAVCGPIGNCNSVQESSYAFLFGFLPVGVLGAVGYIGILLAWLLKTYGPSNYQKFFTLSIWAMAWFGVLFSIYLTFLEPFVIGATCVWCITNAIIISLILLASTAPAKDALRIEYDDEKEDDSELEAAELS
jgi:uncharacterized membrane protein